MELARLHLGEEARDVVVVEGQFPREEGKEDDAARPDVRGRPVVLEPLDDLGRRVVRAPAGRFEEVVVPHQRGETKVRDLDLVVGIEEQVLRLEVPVADEASVAVVQARNDLLEEGEGLAGREPSLTHKVIEELSSLNVLQNKEKGLGGLKDIEEAENIGVIDHFEDGDLSLNLALQGRAAVKHRFLDDLNRHGLPCVLVRPKLDLMKQKKCSG